MAESDGLTGLVAPVFVVDISAIFGCNERHVDVSFEEVKILCLSVACAEQNARALMLVQPLSLLKCLSGNDVTTPRFVVQLRWRSACLRTLIAAIAQSEVCLVGAILLEELRQVKHEMVREADTIAVRMVKIVKTVALLSTGGIVDPARAQD